MIKNKPGHEPANRQMGITEPPQEHLVLVALSLVPTTPPEARAVLERVRAIVATELDHQLALTDRETGELGFDGKYNDYGLTITAGFSSTCYDKLAVEPEARPKDLQPIRADVLNVESPEIGAELAGEGDVVLRIASNDIFVVEHAVRRLTRELSPSEATVTRGCRPASSVTAPVRCARPPDSRPERSRVL